MVWVEWGDWVEFNASLFTYSSSFVGGSGKMVCSDGMDFEEFSFWAADIWGVALRVGSFAHRANPLLGLRKGAFAEGVVGWFAVVRGDLDCWTSRQGQKESGKCITKRSGAWVSWRA